MELELSHVHVDFVHCTAHGVEAEILVGCTQFDIWTYIVGIGLVHIKSLCERCNALPTGIVVGSVGCVEVKGIGVLVACGQTIVLEVDFGQVCALEIQVKVQSTLVHCLSR